MGCDSSEVCVETQSGRQEGRDRQTARESWNVKQRRQHVSEEKTYMTAGGGRDTEHNAIEYI